MKIHTTNHKETLIEVEDDCPATIVEALPTKRRSKIICKYSVGYFEHYPYKFTSGNILFQVYGERNQLTGKELKKAREHFQKDTLVYVIRH